MASERVYTQPSATIFLGNPGFSHPKEEELRREITDPEELRLELKKLYRALKGQQDWNGCHLDLQKSALDAGLELSQKIQGTNRAVRLCYAILLDLPPGLNEMDLIDPARRALPKDNPNKVTHKSLKSAVLPTLNSYREFLREPYRKGFHLFGASNPGIEVPDLRDVLVISEGRARDAIARMEKGTKGYPDISQMAQSEKTGIVEGDTVQCAGVFAGALWWAWCETQCKRIFALWEADGQRVKVSHTQAGADFARKLGVLDIRGRTFSSMTIANDGGGSVRRTSNGWGPEDLACGEE